MMVGLVEFMYRLLNPIEEKSPRMYHFDVAYGQLIGMLLLSLICYQFTIVGEGVYIDAIRAFIRNSSLLVKWQLFSLPVGQHEIQVFFDQLGKPREFWNAGRFTWVIVKGILMAGIIVGYAMIQKRKFLRTCYSDRCTAYDGLGATGGCFVYIYSRYHVDSYNGTIICYRLLSDFCMIVLVLFSTGLLLQTMGRITGACINGTIYEV